MSSIFMDSFDHYGNAGLTAKYDTPGTDTVVNTTLGIPRTGRGCLQIRSAAFGPTKTFPAVSRLMVGMAWNSDQSGNMLFFQNFTIDPDRFQAACVILKCNADRSVSVTRGPRAGSTVLGTSATGVIQFNTYNTVAMEATMSATGIVNVWVNGVQVLTLAGVNTSDPSLPLISTFDGFELMGPGGIPVCYIDDVWALDCTVGTNVSWPGAVKIYAQAPIADAAPIDWTPLGVGDNYEEVDEIPPDDDTSYVFSSGIGDEDQYSYPFAPPANSCWT